MPRPKGSPNVATNRIRNAVSSMLDNTAPEIARWLKEVYEHEGPNEALKRVNDFLEYTTPKMARVDLGNADGEPFQIADGKSDREVIEAFLKGKDV